MLQLPENEASLWRTAYTGPIYPKLTQDIEVDVAIVGAGITGLTSGYLLKQAGLTVAVLDKDTVGGGTTGRTTGKVTSQHSLTYKELSDSIGPRAAGQYGAANQAAVEQVEQIIRRESIDCDWQRADNYVFTADAKQVGKFQAEAEAAASLGLPATFETDLALPFRVAGAVKFANQGKINAQKYVLGLAQAVNGNGSYVYEHSNVTGIRDGSPCRVRTHGASVTAKHIIVATNVPTSPLMARGGYCVLEYPTESYIVAAPYDGQLNGMYISPDSGHYSILPVSIDGQRHILIGGGGHLSGLRGSRKWRFRRLADYAEKQFSVSSLSHRWSDRDYIAYDKVPLVGKLYPWSQHLYVASAFRKWGLSNGTAAAMILTDIISGHNNPWVSVFTPLRLKPITSIPKAVVEQTKQLLNP